MRAVFADLALYLAVGGLASMELSCSLTTLVLQARLAPIPRLPILAVWTCSRSLSLSLSNSSVVGSRSATSNLATALLSARGLHCCIRRLNCCLLEVGLRYVLDLAASHRLCHLCLSLHDSFSRIQRAPGSLAKGRIERPNSLFHDLLVCFDRHAAGQNHPRPRSGHRLRP